MQIFILVTHAPIFVINMIIQIKECSLYIAPILTTAALQLDEPLRSEITLIDFAEALEMLTPVYWGQLFWKIIFGYDPKDIVWENKDDEDHYLPNMIEKNAYKI